MPPSRVKLDLSIPEFLDDWFRLTKEDAEQLRQALSRLHRMTWEQVYCSKGLHWEKIYSTQAAGSLPLYSMRITIKFRAIVRRDGNCLRFASLHPDHDSAYH